MKIRFWLCWLCTLYSLFAIGQNDSTKIKPLKYIELGVGASVPITPFTQPSADPYGGQVGYTINISASCPIKHSNVSGAMLFSYGANSFAGSSYLKNNPTLVVSFQSGKYTETSFLGGFIFSNPTNERGASIDFRWLLAGALVFTNPEILCETYGGPGNPNTYLDLKSSTDVAFAADIGIGFRKFTKKSVFSLNLDACFSNSEHGMNYNSKVAYGTVKIISDESNVSPLDVLLLNVTLNFGFRIGKR